MQNELKAAGAGVVERVAIAPGRTVEKGEVLVTFAPAHLT
jgi:biotin carboxyl carrier protein